VTGVRHSIIIIECGHIKYVGGYIKCHFCIKSHSSMHFYRFYVFL
jgi:hypothetical protein